ncbi:MAG TPA: hypothetical protein VD689_03875, partial [Nitrosopumilaceae archaeon]|nr:hypothetical protein [Nitrosopumilaceae archaeon]
MTKVNHIKFATLFAITVLLTTSLALQSSPSAFAAVRICGDKICDANNGDDAEAEREQMRQQIRNPPPAAPEEPEVPEEAPVEEEMPVPGTTTPEMEVIPEEKMEEKMEKKADHGWKTTTGT